MTPLLIPPVNRNSKTIIDLDYGQQIIIDKDTHFARVQNRLNDPNPATAIQIEPSGICWSFTLEDGVWWRNEFTGDAQRIPQLQKKIRATEEEMIRREQARREWEERTRGSIPDSGLPSTRNYQAQPYYYDQTSSTYGLQDAGTWFPESAVNFVHIQQNAQANNFPPPPSSYFPINTTNHAPYFAPPPIPHGGWASPQPPSFPPGFPFTSNQPPSVRTPSRRSPSPPSPQHRDPSYHAFWSSRRWTPSKTGRVNGVNYMQVGGTVENFYVDQSASVTGNNNNVTWIR